VGCTFSSWNASFSSTFSASFVLRAARGAQLGRLLPTYHRQPLFFLLFFLWGRGRSWCAEGGVWVQGAEQQAKGQGGVGGSPLVRQQALQRLFYPFFLFTPWAALSFTRHLLYFISGYPYEI
jgi:hypothetical protein